MYFFFQGEIKDVYRFVTFYIYYALVLIQFILQLFSDIEAQQPFKAEQKEGERRPLFQQDPEPKPYSVSSPQVCTGTCNLI